MFYEVLEERRAEREEIKTANLLGLGATSASRAARLGTPKPGLLARMFPARAAKQNALKLKRQAAQRSQHGYL